METARSGYEFYSLVKVARNRLDIPFFGILILLAQMCTGFINEQIEVVVTSKEVEDTLFWTFWS